jgi:phosphoribosylformylglycinamidine synthase
VRHGHLGGRPPEVDLAAEKLLGEILVNASRDGLVDAAHDLSDGGLAVALAEATLRNGVGARVWLDAICERDGIDPFTALFSESTARVVVAVPRSEEVRFTDMCTARGQVHARIGVVDDQTDGIDVQGQFAVTLGDLREAHTRTLPAVFGE